MTDDQHITPRVSDRCVCRDLQSTRDRGAAEHKGGTSEKGGTRSTFSSSGEEAATHGVGANEACELGARLRELPIGVGTSDGLDTEMAVLRLLLRCSREGTDFSALRARFEHGVANADNPSLWALSLLTEKIVQALLENSPELLLGLKKALLEIGGRPWTETERINTCRYAVFEAMHLVPKVYPLHRGV